MRTFPIRCLAGLLLTLLAVPSVQAATAAPPAAAALPEGLETGWHTVRPGETLQGITVRYLGSAELWPQVWKLNPDIANPNLLTPGQRVRILRRQGAPAALVAGLSRKVEAQPAPIPWKEAQLGDLLLERDGVRTYPKSSAEMAFPDGTRLKVNEDSLVYLQRTGGAFKGVERKGVEIVQGQADVEAKPAARAVSSGMPSEIEIVLGKTRATARTDRNGAVQTRARRADTGGAKLMAYSGDADVEAGGAKVQVPQGMGTSVEPTGPPAPPEKLLAAPRALFPEEGAQVACANPALTWEPVPDAASYVVEVCRDAGCGTLADRAVGLSGTEWRPASLPAGEFWWRATARSRSGLDGYPAAVRKLAITADRADALPPTGTLAIVGPQVRVGETLFVGPTAKLDVVPADDQSGPAGWRPVLNGQEGAPGEAAGPWAAGAYQIGAVVLDRCGNRGTVAPVAFTVDTTPPGLTWDVLPYDAFAGRGRKAKQARSAPLTWSGGAQWLPLAAGEEIRINADAPQAFFHAPGAHFLADGQDRVLGDNQMLRIRAADTQSSVDHLTFRLVATGGGANKLELETGDLVENSRKASWELRLGGR